MTQVTEGATITSFSYDGDGGRVRKTRDEGGGTKDETTYIGSLFEIQVKGQGSKVEVKHIFAGSQRVCSVTKDEGRGLPAGKAGTTDASYYHPDHLGSSSVITDSSGNQVERYEYTPYGTIAISEIVPRPSSLIPRDTVHHKFTGKELDSTGLYYFGARYYDPEIGRFITPDTIVQAPYDPQSLNRYSYCRNNPINYVDPTGHSWKKFWKKFGDWISPLGRAIATGDWAHFGFQMLNIVGIMSGNPWIMAASFLNYASMATADMPGRTWGNISRGMGYAGQAIGAAYLAWNVGVGVANWIHEPNAGVRLPGGGIGTAQDIDAAGGKIIVPGVNTTEEAAIGIADKYQMPVFQNPTHGPIADFTESLLQKVTFTGSVDRQLANVLSQTTGPVHIFAHSQGALITSNALVQLGFTGNRLARGSLVTNIGAAISQPRASISALIGGARLSGASLVANTLDPINVIGPNLNPVKFFGGIVGGITQGAKDHALSEYGVQIK